MFTGIVEELGKVTAIQKGPKSIRLTVAAGKVLGDVQQGDSIAVNGICLTVVSFASNWFSADVMPETMDRTALGQLSTGQAVNLERALRLGDRLGGHLVSGHIDGTGQIAAKEKNDNAVIIRIIAEPAIMHYVVKKGSVAIDGTSLTIVECDESWFTVSLIPHTAAQTTLGFKQAGDMVNLETDILGKYVEKLLRSGAAADQAGPKISLEFLSEHGFTG
ncbi:ribe: riboflavin synthase alpha subunit [Lucifera butyrica]|uniref:Riboflavin synthase n=1 Tax=Lucifera butyrica TaxID=1351585 RepID=A0A498RCR6_9FIRM|nr:riboflavin synthase [Lucifera butyrica]VBB07932.1 ribe: riboflavin synthase alpha subunit [Lucifera butyrica]